MIYFLLLTSPVKLDIYLLMNSRCLWMMYSWRAEHLTPTCSTWKPSWQSRNIKCGWIHPSALQLQSKNYLEFMILEKVNLILDMKPPISIKKVQQLIGWIVTLSCFLSKINDRCLPFLLDPKVAKRVIINREISNGLQVDKEVISIHHHSFQALDLRS